jgi:hypothetical protein
LTTRPNRSVLRENRKRRIENDGHHISGKPPSPWLSYPLRLYTVCSPSRSLQSSSNDFNIALDTLLYTLRHSSLFPGICYRSLRRRIDSYGPFSRLPCLEDSRWISVYGPFNDFLNNKPQYNPILLEQS